MTFKSKAIVLRSYAWPRNARLYILYTKDFGKVRAVAAGSQKIVSKVAGHLQPFCLTEVMFARGRSIDRLAQARLVEQFGAIPQRLPLFLLASYVIEVIEGLTRDGIADQKLWEGLMLVHKELNEQGEWSDLIEQSSPSRLTWASRVFALQLLERIGARPELSKCLNCRNDLNPEKLSFSLLQGGVVCNNCQQHFPDRTPVEADTIKLLRYGLDNSPQLATRVAVDEDVLDVSSDLVDQLISVQIQRPLNSTAFAQTIQKDYFLV